MGGAGSGLAAVAERALAEVRDGDVVGLGSGRASTAFLHALGDRVRLGLRIRGIPTSEAIAELAGRLGVPLTSFEEVDALDVAVDGADEVDPHLDLIKGLGAALVREKVVAAAARRFVVLVTPEKRVAALGTRGTLPVEAIPFAAPAVLRRLAALGLPADLRRRDGRVVLSDNGNPILDCRTTALADPAATEQAIQAIPGVVGTGLFLGMADLVLVQDGDAVRELRRGDAS